MRAEREAEGTEVTSELLVHSYLLCDPGWKLNLSELISYSTT